MVVGVWNIDYMRPLLTAKLDSAQTQVELAQVVKEVTRQPPLDREEGY